VLKAGQLRVRCGGPDGTPRLSRISRDSGSHHAHRGGLLFARRYAWYAAAFVQHPPAWGDVSPAREQVLTPPLRPRAVQSRPLNDGFPTAEDLRARAAEARSADQQRTAREADRKATRRAEVTTLLGVV
jgi:hypothetical protein